MKVIISVLLGSFVLLFSPFIIWRKMIISSDRAEDGNSRRKRGKTQILNIKASFEVKRMGIFALSLILATLAFLLASRNVIP